jgi:hypothetical protein
MVHRAGDAIGEQPRHGESRVFIKLPSTGVPRISRSGEWTKPPARWNVAEASVNRLLPTPGIIASSGLDNTPKIGSSQSNPSRNVAFPLVSDRERWGLTGIARQPKTKPKRPVGK